MLAVRFFTLIFLWLVAFGAQATAPKATLKPFASEAELQKQLKAWRAKFDRRRAFRADSYASQDAAPAASAVTGDKLAESNSITNVQHAGVDEGGPKGGDVVDAQACIGRVDDEFLADSGDKFLVGFGGISGKGDVETHRNAAR